MKEKVHKAKYNLKPLKYRSNTHINEIEKRHKKKIVIKPSIMDITDKKEKSNKTGSKKKPDNGELIKSMSHIIVEIIEYMANAVVIKTIIKKSTGNISVMSFDSGEGLTEKTSPFDTFSQIIEGKAEIVIDKVSHFLESGQGIIIPAHSPNFIKPNGRFKMILTIIKSGYE